MCIRDRTTPAYRTLKLLKKVWLQRPSVSKDARTIFNLRQVKAWWALLKIVEQVVRLAGIEPTTLGFGGQYSIH